MNTVKDVLELALDRPATAEQIVDPAADVARGRAMLRRRRLVASGGVAAAAAVGALVPVILGTGGAPSHPIAQRSQPAVSTTPVKNGHSSIKLVAFTGDQVPGYQVAEVPEGWVIQGGTPFALVIGAKGDPDTNVDSFTGKLVVMLQSRDASPPTSGQSDPVNGNPGFLDVQGDTQILTFQRADGRWVVIQAPTSLGWDAAKLAQFASGVQVLGNAQPSRG
ncbi:MAG TPA: hypothetical protein VJT16_07835 [Streptosporangiaceae bacterium]|nr:hypothetical protein [Streptosporangiaceae bacterium]